MSKFQRTQSKVWWSHYPEDDEEEIMVSSPSLLPGWGPGVPLSPDRGSPSNGSHKSQDSGFSDSEGSPPISKTLDENTDDHKKPLPSILLQGTPVARIPRACLSRYKTTRSLDKCLNNTWSGQENKPINQIVSLNHSDLIYGLNDLAITENNPDILSLGEARTSFVIESEDEGKQNELTHSPNTTESVTDDVFINNFNNRSESSAAQDSTLDSSVSTTENQTAVFIPKPSPISKHKSQSKFYLPSPILSRSTSPLSSQETALSSRTSSWSSGLDVTGNLGSPTHCSTPKTVLSARIQPRGARVSRRPTKITRSPCRRIEHEEKSTEAPLPVHQWYRELCCVYEPECMTTLQSKSLTADLSRQVTLMAATTTEAVRTLQHRTRIISTEFTKLYRKVEQSELEHIGPLVQSLLGHIAELLALTDQAGSECSELLAAGAALRALAAPPQPQQPALAQGVTRLGQAFTAVVDNLLAQQIKLLVNVLEDPSSNIALLSALSALSGLGLEAVHLGKLISRCNGIRSLLEVCIDSKSTSIRTATLRVLATVCCSTITIRQFEQGGGVEIISDILADEKRSETELTEAVSVLAQITAPWVEDNHSVLGLTEQLTVLVAALTRLANNTTCSPTLLLTAAALCHLSLLEPQCVWRLLECNTAGTLLLAVRREGPHASVFLQEQAAGLLANIAAVPEARPHLAENRAVVALLCFLQVRHSPLQRSAEIAAAERLQHKSAIALSRLCSDPKVAAQVVELQGVHRLVRLCKEDRERNNSDGVLVACLAALRKIVANCGIQVVDELNARELVEPRLLDSFLLYSTRQESYV